MKYDIGQKIIFVGDLTGAEPIKEGTITKTGKDLIWIDHQHNPEDCILKAFVWPFEVKDELQQILLERARLKKQFEDSMSLIYQLSNRCR